jgi:hypothetical protein
MHSKNIFAMSAAAFALAFMASCTQSPESRIVALCTADGSNTRETCECFANSVKESMTEQELNAFAEAVQDNGMDDEATQQRLQQQIGVNGMMKIAAAAKNCSMGAG